MATTRKIPTTIIFISELAQGLYFPRQVAHFSGHEQVCDAVADHGFIRFSRRTGFEGFNVGKLHRLHPRQPRFG